MNYNPIDFLGIIDDDLTDDSIYDDMPELTRNNTNDTSDDNKYKPIELLHLSEIINNEIDYEITSISNEQDLEQDLENPARKIAFENNSNSDIDSDGDGDVRTSPDVNSFLKNQIPVINSFLNNPAFTNEDLAASPDENSIE